jgi:hypothetical protein
MKDTPLIRAAHNGHLATVMYLVEQGADLNTLDLARQKPARLLLAFVLICCRRRVTTPRCTGPPCAATWRS